MRIKNDDVLAHLRSFGFTMQENNAQGFIRWQKRIGDMLVTIANGQFEIRSGCPFYRTETVISVHLIRIYSRIRS